MKGCSLFLFCTVQFKLSRHNKATLSNHLFRICRLHHSFVAQLRGKFCLERLCLLSLRFFVLYQWYDRLVNRHPGDLLLNKRPETTAAVYIEDSLLLLIWQLHTAAAGQARTFPVSFHVYFLRVSLDYIDA